MDKSLKPTIAILVILFTNACSWFFPGLSGDSKVPFPPDNVEVVVPQSEGLSGWRLSPAGDKIVYTSHIDQVIKPILLFPATSAKHNLGTCKGFTWLNDQTLFCSLSSRLVVAPDNENVASIALKKVKSSEVNLSELLQSAGKIYRFERPSLAQTLLLQDMAYPPDPDKNYLIEEVADMDTMLQAYPVTTIPKPVPVGGTEKEIYSPDGRYYYNFNVTENGLFVYDSVNENQLAKFKQDSQEYLTIGGWAADSSGVYFDVGTMGMFVDTEKLDQVLKLKVPE